jgi:hypothetical protein
MKKYAKPMVVSVEMSKLGLQPLRMDNYQRDVRELLEQVAKVCVDVNVRVYPGVHLPTHVSMRYAGCLV